MSLPGFSVARPVAVGMLCLGVMLCGLVALPLLPVELLPSADPLEISVITRLRGGIAPEEVEQRVTLPLEEGLGSLPHVIGMESSSKEGESTIYLRLHPDTNADLTTLEIQEAISKVRSKFPPECEAPIVSKFAVGDRPVMAFAFFSPTLSLEEIREELEQTLKTQLEKLRGVAHVEIVGGREKKILVDVDSRRLKQRGLSWSQVLSTLNAANVQETTGELSRQSTQYPVRVMGAIRSAQELPSLPVSTGSRAMPIALSDIAKVEEGYMKADSHARFNGRAVVGVHVYKENAANTLAVTDRVKAAFKRGSEGMHAKGLDWAETLDQSRFIRDALGSVRDSLLLGGLLAILSLLLFLGDLSHVLVVAVSIPFSVLGTLFVLFLCKGSLNLMTLSGLALGIGMLTDNTIVVLENMRSKGRPKTPALIAEATRQMELPMAASTFTTMVTFLPLIFVSREIQRLYGPLAAVVIGSLCFSLFAAICLAPMLLKILPARPLAWNRLSRPLEELYRGYKKCLAAVLRKQRLFLACAGVLTLASLLLLAGIPKDMLGLFQEHLVLARIRPPAGASLETCNTILRGLEEKAEQLPGVEKYHSFARRDDLRLTLYLNRSLRGPRAKYFVMDSLREKAREYQDTFLYFEGGQQEESVKALDVEVYFDDPADMPAILQEGNRLLGGVPEMKDLRVRSNPSQPEYHLTIDRIKAASLGLSAKEISDQVHLQMRGMVPTRLFQQSGELETVTRLDPEQHKDLASIKKLLLDVPGTSGVPLSGVVDFSVREGPATVWRKDRKRVVQWVGNLQQESMERVAGKVTRAMAGMPLPPGAYWEFGQTYQRFVSMNAELMQAAALVLMLLYLLLTAFFQSFWKPLVIFSSIVTGLVGVAMALTLFGLAITPVVGIGFMVLCGIVVNNSILLVNRYAEASCGRDLSLASLIRASQGRFRPILMTSLTTILGFLPMAFATGESTSLWRPLAITLVGGMLLSTGFTLFLTPVLYWQLSRRINAWKQFFKMRFSALRREGI